MHVVGVRPFADGAAQLALLAHVSSLGRAASDRDSARRDRRSAQAPGQGCWTRWASSGRTSGSGSPTGIAWEPRWTTTAARASSQRWASSGCNGGLAEERRPQQPAGAVDADDARRLHRLGAVGHHDLHLADQLDAPAAVALGGRAAVLGDVGSDLGADLAPEVASRGAPRRRGARWRPPRRRASPTGPRRVCSSTWSRSSVPSVGATRSEPRSIRSIPSSTRSSASQGPTTGPSVLAGVVAPRPPRCRRARRARPAPSGTCGGTSVTSPVDGRRRGGRNPAHAPGAGLSTPVEPYPPAPRTDSGRASTSVKTARSKRWTTSWAIRSPRLQLDRLGAVVVDQQHLDLAAVAGVDGAGGVHDGQPVPGGEPRAGMDQRDVPLGERERDPGRHQGPLAGGEGEVDGGHQVGAGVAGMGVRRERQAGGRAGRRRRAGRARREVSGAGGTCRTLSPYAPRDEPAA